MFDLLPYIQSLIGIVVNPKTAEVIFAIVNIVVIWKYSQIKSNDTVVRTLTDDSKAKDLVIKNLMKAKTEYKLQYEQVNRKNLQLETELKTYHRFHDHKPLVEVRANEVKIRTQKLA